jgi:hypothetical protein
MFLENVNSAVNRTIVIRTARNRSLPVGVANSVCAGCIGRRIDAGVNCVGLSVTVIRKGKLCPLHR